MLAAAVACVGAASLSSGAACLVAFVAAPAADLTLQLSSSVQQLPCVQVVGPLAYTMP